MSSSLLLLLLLLFLLFLVALLLLVVGGGGGIVRMGGWCWGCIGGVCGVHVSCTGGREYEGMYGV